MLLQLLRDWVDADGVRSHSPGAVWWAVVQYLLSHRAVGLRELQLALKSTDKPLGDIKDPDWQDTWKAWTNADPSVPALFDAFYDMYDAAVVTHSQAQVHEQPGLKDHLTWFKFEEIFDSFANSKAAALLDSELEMADGEVLKARDLCFIAASALQLSPYPWIQVSSNRVKTMAATTKHAFQYAVNAERLMALFDSNPNLFDLREGLEEVLRDELLDGAAWNYPVGPAARRPAGAQPVRLDPAILRALPSLEEGMYQATGEGPSGPLSRRVEGLIGFDMFQKGLATLVALLQQPHMGGVKQFVDESTSLGGEEEDEESDNEDGGQGGIDLTEDVPLRMAPDVSKALKELFKVCLWPGRT